MHEVIFVKCDGCKALHPDITFMRTCNLCESEGCTSCTEYKMTKKGLIGIYLHNTSNYGRSCKDAFFLGCEERGIDADY